jgi:hypothetical protein
LLLVLTFPSSNVSVRTISLEQDYWFALALFFSDCSDSSIGKAVSQIAELMIVVDVDDLLVLLG